MNKTEILPLHWTTVSKKVKDIIPCDFNPRKITGDELERLKISIEKFNLVEIPAIDIDNVLLAGHQRIAALFILGRGEEEIDVRIPNRKLSEEEFKEYMLRSNIHNGETDWSKIEDFFQDVDLEGIGMDMDAFEDFLKEKEEEEEEEEAFVEVLPENPQTVISDVYELVSVKKGIKHVFCCGDSTISESFQKVLGSSKIDLLLTDPPYNVNYEGKSGKKLKIINDKMSNDNFFQFLSDFFVNAYSFSKGGAPAYVFYADNESVNFKASMQAAQYKISSALVWVKNHFVFGRMDYHMKHEMILYAWRDDAAHPWYSDRKQSSVVLFDKPLVNEDHPTMKPVEMLEYFMENSSKQNDIVFDGFLGSGSTLIACEKKKRQCRGLELDPRYADVVLRRWVSYMRQNALEFRVVKNGSELSEEEISAYEKKD